MGEIVYFCYTRKNKRKYVGKMFEKIVQEIKDKREKGYEDLHIDLLNTVNSEQFAEDIPGGKSKAASPHEIMSAIIGIENFVKHYVKNLLVCKMKM